MLQWKDFKNYEFVIVQKIEKFQFNRVLFIIKTVIVDDIWFTWFIWLITLITLITFVSLWRRDVDNVNLYDDLNDSIYNDFVNNSEYVKSYLTILRENFDFNQQVKQVTCFFRRLTMTSDIRQLATTNDY